MDLKSKESIAEKNEGVRLSMLCTSLMLYINMEKMIYHGFGGFDKIFLSCTIGRLFLKVLVYDIYQL